jgi:RNA polymerase sigma factor (sigma-70 family)
LRYAHGLVGQRETAEDLVQDAFLKLHAHWDEVIHPRAWLFRCVRNLSLSHLRDHRRETSLDPERQWESSSPNPEQALEKSEAIDTLQGLLAELSEEDRALIAFKYREDLKYEQISQRTGLSVSNVGYKLHHLLKNLAESLHRLGVDTAEG